MKTIQMFFLLSALVPLGYQHSNGQWVQQNSGVNTTITDIAMLDTATAVAVGQNGTILRTTNAGSTWVSVVLPANTVFSWNAISFFDPLNGIIVGGNNVAVTGDGGKNWRPYSLLGKQKIFAALHIGPADIFIGGDSGWVYHTLDTGKTWTSEKISAWPIRSLFAWTGVYVLGLPVFALTPYSVCNTFVFPSGTWKETIIKDFQALGSGGRRATFCKGGGPAFIVGVQGDLRSAPAIIRKKSMSDTVWSGVSQNIFHDGVLLGISAPSTNVIYVCGDGGMLFESIDGGDTWKSFGVTMRNLTSVSFYNEARGFSVGDSGTILYTNNGGGVTGVGQEQSNMPKNFSLEQNYPNPFNPATIIDYQLAMNSVVTLKIYDVLGREVATLINEQKAPGSYEVSWDATSYSSGVYFYELRVGGFVRTKSMVLVK